MNSQHLINSKNKSFHLFQFKKSKIPAFTNKKTVKKGVSWKKERVWKSEGR